MSERDVSFEFETSGGRPGGPCLSTGQEAGTFGGPAGVASANSPKRPLRPLA